MDLQRLGSRAREIVVHPQLEWAKVAAEETSVVALYQDYILWLAALPALIGFVKASLIGYSAFGAPIRIDPTHGLTQLVLVYAVNVGVVYVMALIVDVLASGFGGAPDQRRATQLAAYSMSAYWLSSLGALVPFVSLPVMLLGWGYTAYLVYLGLPVLTRCDRERASGYAVTVVFLSFVVWAAALAAARIVAGVNTLLSGPSTFVS